jgi:hypothetical protein
VLHKGKQVYVQGEPLFTTEYSDSLMMFLLKANNPEKFRDRIEQVNIQDIAIDKLSPEVLDKLAEQLIQKALAGKPREMIEEARKRINAGEEVSIEELEQHQAERERAVTVEQLDQIMYPLVAGILRRSLVAIVDSPLCLDLGGVDQAA